MSTREKRLQEARRRIGKDPEQVADRWLDLEDRVANLEAALQFIAEQEPLTFAECSVAEAIVSRAKAALGN
jgi:midasin (ATPase involved in ribosome maturation)